MTDIRFKWRDSIGLSVGKYTAPDTGAEVATVARFDGSQWRAQVDRPSAGVVDIRGRVLSEVKEACNAWLSEAVSTR